MYTIDRRKSNRYLKHHARSRLEKVKYAHKEWISTQTVSRRFGKKRNPFLNKEWISTQTVSRRFGKKRNPFLNKEWISTQTVSRRFGKKRNPFSTMPKLERLKQRSKKSMQMPTEWSRKDKKDYIRKPAQGAEQAGYYGNFKMLL
ncbi:hypothetical protein BgiMline_031779 [Biomphalaria glabrata]